MNDREMLERFRVEVEGFLAESGMSPSYFAKRIGSSELLSRMRDNPAGWDCRVSTLERARRFIKDERRRRSRAEEAGDAA